MKKFFVIIILCINPLVHGQSPAGIGGPPQVTASVDAANLQLSTTAADE